ncbi:hypothetical protein V1477_019605, partial [Vespula maculifrons]
MEGEQCSLLVPRPLLHLHMNWRSSPPPFSEGGGGGGDSDGDSGDDSDKEVPFQFISSSREFDREDSAELVDALTSAITFLEDGGMEDKKT